MKLSTKVSYFVFVKDMTMVITEAATGDVL